MYVIFFNHINNCFCPQRNFFQITTIIISPPTLATINPKIPSDYNFLSYFKFHFSHSPFSLSLSFGESKENKSRPAPKALPEGSLESYAVSVSELLEIVLIGLTSGPKSGLVRVPAA